jgi:cyclase
VAQRGTDRAAARESSSPMHRSSISATRRRILASLGALTSPGAVLAQLAQSASPADEAITADLLRTGLYLLHGGGCQSLLRLNAAGCVLVNGKRGGTYRPLMSLVRRINKLSDLPLRGVIYTNHHDIHSGNHAQFIAGGVSVLVQSNCLPRLPIVPLADTAIASAPRSKRPPGVAGGFDHNHRFTIGGVEVRLHHFGPAQTDNDAVVLFPDLRVLGVGELFSSGLPLPDYAAGGSLLGWKAALDSILDLPFDIAIPSGDAPKTRAEVSEFRRRMQILVDRAAHLVKNNVSKGEFKAQMKSDDLGWNLQVSEQEVDLLYRDLGQTR